MRSLPCLLLTAALAACAAPVAEENGNEAKPDRALLEKKRNVARMTAEAQRRKDTAAIDQAEREVAAAQAELDHFNAHAAPLEIEKAELALVESENALAESREEYEQLKLMYAKQDLADTTRELVLHRTERRLAQKEKELAHERAELTSLKEGELAQKRTALELARLEKQKALDAARLDARVANAEKEIEVLEAEQALEEGKEGAAEDGGGDEKQGEKPGAKGKTP